MSTFSKSENRSDISSPSSTPMPMHSTQRWKVAQDQIDERIVRNKQEARRALDKLTADIEQQTELSDTRKQAISSLVDNLNQQIALIQAASRETLPMRAGKYHDGSRKIEDRD